MTRTIAFEGIQFSFGEKKGKDESLEQFHANLVELASHADCSYREDEWVLDMITSHMKKGKKAEEFLIQTKFRNKGIEHSKTMKTNLFESKLAVTIK